METSDMSSESKITEFLKRSVEDFLSIDTRKEQICWDKLAIVTDNFDQRRLLLNSDIPENFNVLWRNMLISVTDLINPKCFIEKSRKTTFDCIFFEGHLSTSLIVLCNVFEQTSASYKQDVVLGSLEHFMKTDCIVNLLVEQSSVPLNHHMHHWKDLITILVSLPERVANRLEGRFRPFFELTNYYSRMATVIVKVLHQIHKRLERGCDSSLEFSSQLLGRLSLAGKCGNLFQSLTSMLLKLMHKNFLWKKIVGRLFCGVPNHCLESVCFGLFRQIPWYGYVEYFFGDTILNKPVLKFLITNKFILGSYLHIPTAQNSLGYLISSNTRRDLFFQTVSSILGVWGDKSGLVHQTQQQHYYLSSVIMIVIGYMKSLEIPQHIRNDFNSKLLHGVQNHLSHSDGHVRNQGMFVGQSFVEVIDPNGPKLAFEFDMTPDLETLHSLVNIPEEPNEDWTEINEELFENFEQMSLSVNASNVEKEVKVDSVEDLDSDDDLEPYDLSNDVPSEQEKRPYYIRDCLEGLIKNRDADWTQACLESAKELIFSQKPSVCEISIDLVRVLLNLENTFAITDFISLRFRALVAVCSVCPQETATFLTKEFYDQNYNIRQRLDILEVIAATSQELSSIPKISPTNSLPISAAFSEKPWNEIIKKRLEEKTRIISKGRKKESVPTENHFGEAAGYFFFPLMQHFDRKENTFDLLGEDHYVLGRLFYTLGIVLNCAANCLVFKQMSRALLEFVWVLRYHTERFVRQALMFAVGVVFLNISPHVLINEFEVEFVESQQWLTDVFRQDPDEECKRRSAQLLELISRISDDFYNTNKSE